MVSKLIFFEHMALLFLAIFNILLSETFCSISQKCHLLKKTLFENQVSSRTISFLYLYTGHNPGNNLTPASWRNSTWTKCPTVKLAVCSRRWFAIRWQLRIRCILFASREISYEKILPQGGGPTLILFELGLALRVLYIEFFFKAP